MPFFAYSYVDILLDRPPGEMVDWDQADWDQLVKGKIDGAIEQIYQDLGDRSQLNALIHICQQHVGPQRIQILIRELRELGDSLDEICDRLQQFEHLNVELIVLNASDQSLLATDVDSTQNSSRSELWHALQALQQTQRNRNLQRGHARNRLNLKPPPGKAPYGYRRGKDRYILDRSTAPVVKDFFEHFLLYGSLRRSVRYLAQKYNKKISVSTGKRWLSNPVYRGHLAYKTGDMITGTHAAILSEDEAAQVDRLLRRNRQLPRRSAGAQRSLAGLVQCAHCQSPMRISRVTQRRKQKDYLYLRPSQCPLRKREPIPSPNTPATLDQTESELSSAEGDSRLGQSLASHQSSSSQVATLPPHSPPCSAIPYEDVLDQTIDQICDTLPQVFSTTQIPDLGRVKQGIQSKIKAQQQILEQLPDLEKTGVLDAETCALRAYNVRTQISDLQASLAQLPPVNLRETIQTVSLRQFWLDLSESERRFYFREFIHHIEIVRPALALSPTRPTQPLSESTNVSGALLSESPSSTSPLATPMLPKWHIRLVLLLGMDSARSPSP